MVRAFDLSKVGLDTVSPVVWHTREQAWSCIMWGKPGLAARKIVDGCSLSQILGYDHWGSRDELAQALDTLCSKGSWYGEGAWATDPGDLRPEVVSTGKAGYDSIRWCALLCVAGVARNDSAEGKLEGAQEALRLQPKWEWAQKVVADLRSLQTP